MQFLKALQSYFDHMINHMSEFWPFPLTSYHLSELSFDWVFFLQIQNLSLFYHFPKLLNFSSPGTDTASTKPFLEAGPHWNLQVLSKFYHLTELVFIEKYPYHLSELSYEWVIFFAPSARFYHMTELSYDRITTVVGVGRGSFSSLSLVSIISESVCS